MRGARRARIVVALAAALAPAAAQANAGIGFFSPGALSILFGIVPVILVEGVVLRWKLPVGTGRAFVLALVANLASAILGAIIGFGLDLALIAASGASGFSGPVGFTVSLVFMFGLSWWIEKQTVAGMSPAIPLPAVGSAVLVANVVTYAMLVVAVFLLVAQEEPYLDRARVTEVINVMRVERTAVIEHHASTGSFPPARTVERPTANTRRLVREADGRIVGVLASKRPELDGKAIVHEPQVRGRDIVGWKCFVPEAPLKLMPAACRFRSAAQAPVD